MEIFSTEYLPVISFLTAFIVVLLSIPSIIKVAQMKHLYDEPDHRTSHTRSTPTLGGIAIFAGVLISMGLWINFADSPELKFVISALVIMFFIGIKDDILIIAPLTKLGGQIVAAIIIVVVADLRITSLHGFYGITDISYFISAPLSVFIILVIINGFNLIDGIDGLSSGVGTLTAITFGYWFFISSEIQYSLLAFSLAGGLAAFFRYNVFSRTKKIFMGDTGSLILGIIISVLAIRFNEINTVNYLPTHVHSAPAVTIGILIVPLFDTIRVMFIRVITGRGLFQADKNHIHHRLLELGFSHIKATMIILFFNICFIAFVFYFQRLEILRLTLLLILLAMAFSHIPVLIIERRKKKFIQNTNTKKSHKKKNFK